VTRWRAEGYAELTPPIQSAQDWHQTGTGEARNDEGIADANRLSLAESGLDLGSNQGPTD